MESQKSPKNQADDTSEISAQADSLVKVAAAEAVQHKSRLAKKVLFIAFRSLSIVSGGFCILAGLGAQYLEQGSAEQRAFLLSLFFGLALLLVVVGVFLCYRAIARPQQIEIRLYTKKAIVVSNLFGGPLALRVPH